MSADKVREIANLALQDALQILALTELLRSQNTGAALWRESKPGRDFRKGQQLYELLLLYVFV